MLFDTFPYLQIKNNRQETDIFPVFRTSKSVRFVAADARRTGGPDVPGDVGTVQPDDVQHTNQELSHTVQCTL